MGRKEGATVTTGGSVWPAFLKFPWPVGAPRQRGKEKGRPARLSRGVALFLELFS